MDVAVLMIHNDCSYICHYHFLNQQMHIREDLTFFGYLGHEMAYIYTINLSGASGCV